MAFKVIKGTFHIAGYSPDGDSVRFKAADADNWKRLDGRVKLNAKGHAQLRIEAIDTLETHFKDEHQPRKFADAATDQLFQLLEIKNVVWNAGRTKVLSADDGTEGWIATRMAEKYGRPVSFVFGSAPELEDGQEIYLDQKLVQQSVNYQLLAAGLAYPTFYDGMFYDLREFFAKTAAQAREARAGLWAEDTTNIEFHVTSLADVTEKHVILPKLFRRIVAHMKENGEFEPNAFLASLREEPENVFILSLLHFTHLDNLLDVHDANSLNLRYRPEDLIFLG